MHKQDGEKHNIISVGHPYVVSNTYNIVFFFVLFVHSCVQHL
jgi:hypothetical protein